MKYHLYFISNSSSSSFICDVCNQTFSGWDASPSEFDHHCFYESCGHTVCNDKLLPSTIDIEADDYDEYSDSTRCPICQFKKIAHDDIISYLIKKDYKSINEVEEEIRLNFNSYKEFMDFLKQE